MENTFQTFLWKYVSRKPRKCVLVIARERKTADELIAIENAENIYSLKPALFFFKKPISITKPPYDLELDQKEAAEKALEQRRTYFTNHPEDRCWIKGAK